MSGHYSHTGRGPSHAAEAEALARDAYRQNVLDMLEEAIAIVRAEPDPHRAAWRIADAAGLLREWLQVAALAEGLIGVTEPTSRGFVLPRRGASDA